MNEKPEERSGVIEVETIDTLRSERDQLLVQIKKYHGVNLEHGRLINEQNKILLDFQKRASSVQKEWNGKLDENESLRKANEKLLAFWNSPDALRRQLSDVEGANGVPSAGPKIVLPNGVRIDEKGRLK